MIHLTPIVEQALPVDAKLQRDLELLLSLSGFRFNHDPDESWLFATDRQGKFLMMHRYLALTVTSSDVAVAALSEHMPVVSVSSYEAEELWMERSSLEPLSWGVGLYPEDPHGIDLRAFSANDLYFATV